MEIIWKLIVGLVVGVLARLLLPGKEAFPEGALGWLLTALLGIIGAWLGSFLGTQMGLSAAAASGWIMSILGAIILLVIFRLIMGARNSTSA